MKNANEQVLHAKITGIVNHTYHSKYMRNYEIKEELWSDIRNR